MQICQNVYLTPKTSPTNSISKSTLDKISLLAYQDLDKKSTTSPELDYSPKRKTKPRICTKHESHTPEELEKCLDLMEKNRIASLKSRRKKMTIIDQQKRTIQALENQVKHAQFIARKAESEKSKIKNENQELKAIVINLQGEMTNLQAQMTHLLAVSKSRSEKSASPEIDVEKIEEDKPFSQPSSVNNVANLMQNATLTQSPLMVNQDFINLMCNVSPEFARQINSSSVKSPYTPPNFNTPPATPTMGLLQRMQPSPLLRKTDQAPIQYAPKPGLLNLSDENGPFVHNPSKYHLPLFQKIVYQFYGESPVKLGNTLPSTSKNIQK